MTVISAIGLYRYLDNKIPSSLSAKWDNDGLMCCPDPSRPIKKVLLALDPTDKTVDAAISGGYDLVLTHHPLVFSPISHLEPSDPVAAKLIRLVGAGVSVFSFHTRLDALAGGVNDVLAERLGILDTVPFGDDGEDYGRVGTVDPMPFCEFAAKVKSSLSAPMLTVVDSSREVRRVAVLGGAGKDALRAAIAAGADTYVTGEMGHHPDIDAAEAGINLILAGHHYTEVPVLDKLRELVSELDETIEFGYFDSDPVGFL